jgi:hypothetical protein
MDILNLNKLMEETRRIESIAESVEDTNDYNIVTKKVNNPIMEGIDDLDGIISRGSSMNNEIDFSELENAISGLTECANAPASVKTTIVEKMKEPMKAKVGEVKAKVESSAANPSQGITNAKAFLNADPIKQTDFVKANTAATECKKLEDSNTASELPVTGHKTETAVDTQAEKVMKEKMKGADQNKKWEEIAKKQNKLATNSVKFESFMKDLESDDNRAFVESATQAFNILIKKYL